MSLPLMCSDPVEREQLDRQYKESVEQYRKAWTAELTLMQKIALLKMHNWTISHRVARTLIATEAFHNFPCYADYCAVAAAGLAERPEGVQYHELTVMGATRARLLAIEECKRIPIHIMRDCGMTRDGDCSYSCTCGQWSWRGRAGRSTQGNVNRSYLRHLTRAEAPSIVPSINADADAARERIE